MRQNKEAKEEIISRSYRLPGGDNKIAFLGYKEKILSALNPKKIWLNIRIYGRISSVFLKKMPQMLLAFFVNLPKNLKKEGSKIKIQKRRFELAKIWPHLGIGLILVVVLGSSVFAKDTGYHNASFNIENLEPSEYADLAVSVDPYTQFISEKDNATIAQLAMMENVVASDESYILAPAEVTTIKSPKESVKPSSRTSYLSYQVLGGETLSHIGAKFDVSTLSLVWANPDLKNPDVLTPGSTLEIPPRNGYTVLVEKGQSLEGLIKKHSGNFEETLAANSITDPATIFSGQKILIADGKPAQAPVSNPKIAKNTSGSVRGAMSSATGSTVPSGTFIWPTSGNVCNTRHRGYYAIDICAGGASPAIIAADGGVVVSASYGWNSGWGNNVLIDHGNGLKTRYSHMRVLNVATGQSVSKGQQVGIMGTTGNSTGIHLHFEVYVGPVRVNPLAYLH